ncbi:MULTISPECIES: ABC transporter permease [Brevibacterium]|uniref:ABC transporter permease n=1 Tax=Brevibacterium casei TaxID=33889 RepID=A0A7T4A0D5_9MICO|nr:ABC transporter permease [Brevibacterium casei]QQB14971.1 ABC transporter permease [Brevibacterium casei]
MSAHQPIPGTHLSTPVTTTRASFATAIGLVIEREIMVRLRSKAFVVSTLLGVILFGTVVAVSGSLPSLFASTDKVAVTSADSVAGIDGIEPVVVGSTEEAEELVRSEEVSAAVVDSADSPTGTTIIALRAAPESLSGALSLTPTVDILDPNAPDPALTRFIGLGLGLIFLSSAMTFGMTIASSVVEEKQSRIVEILLASTSARAIMFGKVIACSVLAFAQVALTAVAVLVGAAISGNDLVLGRLADPIAWFIPLFVVGFVMIAALYAAAASMVSRSEDLGSTSTPIMMLILLPYMGVVLFSDNEAIMAVLSYIPFSAAVAVPMRVFMGTTAWWEPLVSLAILSLTTVLALLLATRIFEQSILKSGPKVSWKQALGRA